MTRGRLALLIALYAMVTTVMAGPLINYSALDSATYDGDARLIVWTLAWDNHATLSRLPLFDSNIFYPSAHSLAYNEHLFGLSLFTLPVYALTNNPVLAYNAIWWLSFVLNLLASHALLKRYVHDDVAACSRGTVPGRRRHRAGGRTHGRISGRRADRYRLFVPRSTASSVTAMMMVQAKHCDGDLLQG